MRHELVSEGLRFRLRPIGDADAGFVVGLRSDPELGRYLHETDGRVESQLAWLAAYYERAGDYYFVVERRSDGGREGVVGIYDLDAQTRSAEWGRWILRRGSMGAVESAWLVYRTAFESVGLDSIYCRTLAENAPLVSFHDSCGIPERELIRGCFEIRGRRVDAVRHRLTREAWASVEPRLERLARRAARSAND